MSTSAKKEFSLILANDGTVYASGQNMYGQLGTGNTNDVLEFTKVIDHTVMLKNNANIETFGKVNPYDVLNGGSSAIVIRQRYSLTVYSPAVFHSISSGR